MISNDQRHLLPQVRSMALDLLAMCPEYRDPIDIRAACDAWSLHDEMSLSKLWEERRDFLTNDETGPASNPTDDEDWNNLDFMD